MMNVRYQVFVSSTYTDLKEERANVSRALLEVDCIPVGMELFPAVDQQQLEFIKTVIDTSDYYVLIIGGRYGTIAETGISYTEMEYEYATSIGIPVFGFFHEDPDSIPSGKTDRSAELLHRLETFKRRVADRRLVKFWKSADELPSLVVSSITTAIRRTPGTGWIRGNRGASPDMLNELLALRKENEILRQRTATETTETVDPLTADLSRILGLKYTVTRQMHFGALDAALSNTLPATEALNLKLIEILKFIGLETKPNAVVDFHKLIPQNRNAPNFHLLSQSSPTYRLTDRSIEIIRLACEATQLAKFDSTGGVILTDLGKRALFNTISDR